MEAETMQPMKGQKGSERVRNYPKGVSALYIAALCIALAGCQTPAPVDKPCGVIRDDLKTVFATTPAGQQRLDIHFERGRSAGCWT